MRRKDESKKPIIVSYINDFFYEHDKVPMSSKNSDLGAAERYLIFQHDESSNKPVLDE